MQIVEVKNNLVQVLYNPNQENLILSGFVVIKDIEHSFIGQIIHLEANSGGNFAIVKLIFNFNSDGVITNYDGSIPSLKGNVESIQPQELLELLPIQNPTFIGPLAQQQMVLSLDNSMFEQKLLICSEKEDDNEILVKNFASQLALNGKKVLIIDLNGNLDERLKDNSQSGLPNFTQEKILAGRDFKLPLNYETINFIYNGLDDAKAETKATIQEIFLEVQNYVKTLPEKFIPFETFKNVVDSQYEETELVELVLLKNKLLKYYEAGVFAQEKDEFNALKFALKNKGASVLDLSKMDEKVQREMISYAYSLINEINEHSEKEIYVILNLENESSDKKLLKQIFTTKNARSILLCAYSFKYLKELKQLSKNLILFAPIQHQSDFAGYSVFLNKLNPHEFIVYGKATQHLPLIVKLSDIPASAVSTQAEQNIVQETREELVEELVEEVNEEAPVSVEELLDQQIRQDVDSLFTAPKTVEYEAQEITPEFQEAPGEFSDETEMTEEDLTDEDLDLIDDLNIVEMSPKTEELNVEQPVEFEEQEIEEGSFAQQMQELQNPELMEQAPSVDDILPINMSSTPIVPIYPADIEPQVQSDEIGQGDIVMHAKYGKGVVEKLINYGSKTLCSIQFDNVGRRLLDPTLAEIKKV